MIVKLSDYIVSPLALGTQANYQCVKAGMTRLCLHQGVPGPPEPFVASVMPDDVLSRACQETGLPQDGYTRFEQMAILAAARALQGVAVDPQSPRVLFILATTKGNVGLLGDPDATPGDLARHLPLTEAALRVSQWFRNPNAPLVVCNACISGLSAQLEACRALASRRCDYAVVIGADVLSPFVVSGFQSLKAMSGRLCRPFDEDRTGLNLGEAAACVVYGRAEACVGGWPAWCVVRGAVRNDACHVSSPSKTAEGAYRALRAVCRDEDLSHLAFVNVHGTATLFNDEMEAVAIDRMGLSACPLNGLKGYFGHTLGAAGLLETLISMAAADDHTVLATKGFEHPGVSRQVSVSGHHREARGQAFVKMMSGFGGCNAALLFARQEEGQMSGLSTDVPPVRQAHVVRLTERGAVVDGRPLQADGQGMALLKSLYHTYINDYPKFYKMDPLCRLGFVASELLLQAEAEATGTPRFAECEDRAVILVGRSASACADRAYQATIREADNYYPSPSSFIYTLPNILAGEIAIRNHYHGETSYLVQDRPDQVETLLLQAFQDPGTRSVLGGWIDIDSTEAFEATLYLIK